MAHLVKNDIKYDHCFDRKTKRHYINGHLSVLHCHHYAILYTQLALDAGEETMLKDVSRETFFEVLKSYLDEHHKNDSPDVKIDIACQYYALVGLGRIKVVYLGNDSGEVHLLDSHLDSGWLKKWKEFDRPVNYITAGYIEALAAAVMDKPVASYNAQETSSIVMGESTGKFTLTFKNA